MSSGLRLVVENSPPVATVRRNLLVVSGLGFLLSYAKSDASQFKFFEVRIADDALYGCLFFVCLYYFLMFTYRVIMMLIIWRLDANKSEAERLAEFRDLQKRLVETEVMEMLDRQRTIAAIENGPAARWTIAISASFDFIGPWMFGLVTLIGLAFRFSLADVFISG